MYLKLSDAKLMVIMKDIDITMIDTNKYPLKSKDDIMIEIKWNECILYKK